MAFLETKCFKVSLNWEHPKHFWSVVFNLLQSSIGVLDSKKLIGSFAGTQEHDFDSKTRGQVVDLGNNEYLINSSLDKKIYHLKCINQIDHNCVSNLILKANNDIAHINIFERY